MQKSGQARPSFVTNYLEKLQVESASAQDKETIQQVATVLYIGGIDTVRCLSQMLKTLKADRLNNCQTDVALQTFFLAMALHPEVQKKAQEELDRVVGKDNLPSFSNQESLPYIDAICKEIQRWHAVAPLALPHRLMQDDIVGEYFIPKGTLIFGNTRLKKFLSSIGPAF